MASIKAQAAANKRKLTEKIGDENTYVRDLVNDDLDVIDVLRDEYNEVLSQLGELQDQIDDEDDADARKELRAKSRELVTEARVFDVRMVDAYIEKADGERFGVEVLAATPVRTLTLLLRQANAMTRAEDPEDPTTAGNATV
jgi:hypothetical protein